VATNNAGERAEQMRILYGFWVVVLGFGLVALVALAAIYKWTTAAEVATVVSSITGVVGTVVGAFFGLQVGSAGKAKAEADRNAAEERALRLAAAVEPAVAMRVLNREAGGEP
jgi:hypothetical protein